MPWAVESSVAYDNFVASVTGPCRYEPVCTTHGLVYVNIAFSRTGNKLSKVILLADGMQYLRDTCMTLCYFLQAYASGTQVLSQGRADVISQLTSLHDDLLPTLAKAAASTKQQPLAQQVKHCYSHTSCTPLLHTSLATKCACDCHRTQDQCCSMPHVTLFMVFASKLVPNR